MHEQQHHQQREATDSASALVRRASDAADDLSRRGSQAAGQVGVWMMLSPGVCGMIASICAGNVIYPNDTVRRRLQTVAGSGETYLDATRALVREGGLLRLYRGFFLYNLKAAPSAAVQFYTYHELKRLWLRRSDAESVKTAFRT